MNTYESFYITAKGEIGDYRRKLRQNMHAAVVAAYEDVMILGADAEFESASITILSSPYTGALYLIHRVDETDSVRRNCAP